jgi:hypothetical protein
MMWWIEPRIGEGPIFVRAEFVNDRHRSSSFSGRDPAESSLSNPPSSLVQPATDNAAPNQQGVRFKVEVTPLQA